MNNTEEKKDFSQIGLAYFAGAITYYVLVSLVFGLLAKSNSSFLTTNTSMITSYVILLLIGYPLMFFLLKDMPVAKLPKKNLSAGMTIVAFMSAYFVMIVCNVLGLIMNSQLGKLTGKGIMNPITNVIGELSFPLQIIIVMILAPIAEELVFRKMLIDRIYKHGELLAAITSGLMFGLFHGNFQQFCYAFGMGIFFSFIYMRTGKIIYTIAFHVLINTLGSLPAHFFMKGIDIQLVQNYIFSGQIDEYMAYVTEHMAQFAAISIYGFVTIIFVVAAFAVTIVFHKKFRFEKHESDLAGKQAVASLFCNIGMIIFVIWWVFNIVLAQFGLDFSGMLMSLIMKL